MAGGGGQEWWFVPGESSRCGQTRMDFTGCRGLVECVVVEPGCAQVQQLLTQVRGFLAPDGPVYQAGTLSGNPVATAAGLATLRGCTGDLYPRLEATATTIAQAASAALTAEGVAHRVQWAGSMFSVFFREGAVTSFADAQEQDTAAYGRFFQAMLKAGVHLPPSAFEAWFVSGAHDEDAVATVLAALPGAARAAATT